MKAGHWNNGMSEYGILERWNIGMMDQSHCEMKYRNTNFVCSRSSSILPESFLGGLG